MNYTLLHVEYMNFSKRVVVLFNTYRTEVDEDIAVNKTWKLKEVEYVSDAYAYRDGVIIMLLRDDNDSVLRLTISPKEEPTNDDLRNYCDSIVDQINTLGDLNLYTGYHDL